MGIFDGCLLASDLDGTLIFGENIPKRNVEAIDYFVSEGGIFSVATGRSPAAVDGVLNEFKNIGPSVFTNGSVIFDYSKKLILHQRFLSSECNTAINEVLNYGVCVGIQAHSNGKVYVPVFTENIRLHIRYELIKHIDCSVEEAVAMPLNKIMYFIDEQDRVEDIVKRLRSLNLNCEFFVSSATIYGKFCKLIEQCPKNVTKVYGLNYLLNNLKFFIKCGNLKLIDDIFLIVLILLSIATTSPDIPTLIPPSNDI